MKNFKTKLFAAAMAAPLAMSGMSVFAEGEVATSTEVPVIKSTITMAPDITPRTLTLTYTATPADENTNDTITDYPVTEPVVVTYTADKATTRDGMKVFTDESTLFSGISYPHAGVYTWNVTQKAEASGALSEGVTDNLTVDTKSYTVRAYVYNNIDNQGNLADGTTVRYTVQATGGAKEGLTDGKLVMSFANEYSQSFENTEKGVFSLTHMVAGALGDKEKEFNYELVVTAPANANDKSITVDGFDVKNNDGTYTLTAKHGQIGKITKAPVGTTVEIKATNVPTDYTTTWTGAVGKDENNRNANATITASGTYVTATHTKDDTKSPIMGNIINNMPFLGLIAVALGGFIAYIALKRRQNA